jgi:hypothetical protein
MLGCAVMGAARPTMWRTLTIAIALNERLL